MGDQHPLDPFAEFEGILDALRDAALRLPGVGSEDLTNLRRSASEALMAVEREALMTFARANGIREERLWKGVSEISNRGRVTVENFFWCELTDP